MLCDKIAKRCVVTPEIFVEFVYPVLAVVIGRDKRLRTEAVQVAHLVDVDSTVYAPARRCIAADNISALQSGSIERFRRRVQDDSLLIDGSHRNKSITRHDELAMNLVADDAHMMTKADITHALQFLTRPYTTRRIMRIAEQENRCLLVSATLFEILPIDFKATCYRLLVGIIGCATGQAQYALRHLATRIANAGEEAVVVWRQHHHLLARKRQCFQHTRNTRNDTSSI